MSRLATGCMLLTVALAALPLAGAQTQAKGNKYAFLVGCSKYLKTDFRQLPFTDNDVKGFREALLQTGYPEDNVVVLHDATKDPRRYLPEKSKILKELDLLVNGMSEHDTLVVALSGHGLQFKGDPVSYFVPVDGKVQDKSTLIALSGKDGLYERLKKCKAQQKLLIVNACRNDPTTGLNFSSNKVELVDEDRSEVPEGIAAIYSCLAGQESYYDPDRKLALFFDHVIRAWKGEYGTGGDVTLEKFFEQVTVKTRMDANKTLGVAQTPAVQREYVGKWVIATAALAKPKPKELLLAKEFEEFSRIRMDGPTKANVWLEQHAAARVVEWRDAANRGLPEAMVLFGECLENGKGLPRNIPEAAKWYRNAADQGNALGQINLGMMHKDGRGVQKDDVEAVKWFRKAADLGDAAGQMSLGRMYQDGRGVSMDEAEAVKWFHKSAEQGNVLGQMNLAVMYENGRGVKKDEVEAGKWFRKAAEQGNAGGQNSIGLMYQNGRGGLKDDKEAVKWYRKAADQGNAAGLNNLGWMFQNGRGVPKDEIEAVKLYSKSAEKGNSLGQIHLGLMYLNGHGGPKDEVEAAKWFRKAADQGNALGQMNLARMYETGHGVTPDLAEAVRLYRLASQAGNQAASDALRRLGKK